MGECSKTSARRTSSRYHAGYPEIDEKERVASCARRPPRAATARAIQRTPRRAPRTAARAPPTAQALHPGRVLQQRARIPRYVGRCCSKARVWAKMHLPPLTVPALLSLGVLQASCLVSASGTVSAVAPGPVPPPGPPTPLGRQPAPAGAECGSFAGPVAGKVNVACVGDSITFGAHSSGGNTTYPGQLQIMLDTKYPGMNHRVSAAIVAYHFPRLASQYL